MRKSTVIISLTVVVVASVILGLHTLAGVDYKARTQQAGASLFGKTIHKSSLKDTEDSELRLSYDGYVFNYSKPLVYVENYDALVTNYIEYKPSRSFYTCTLSPNSSFDFIYIDKMSVAQRIIEKVLRDLKSNSTPQQQIDYAIKIVNDLGYYPKANNALIKVLTVCFSPDIDIRDFLTGKHIVTGKWLLDDNEDINSLSGFGPANSNNKLSTSKIRIRAGKSIDINSLASLGSANSNNNLSTLEIRLRARELEDIEHTSLLKGTMEFNERDKKFTLSMVLPSLSKSTPFTKLFTRDGRLYASDSLKDRFNNEVPEGVYDESTGSYLMDLTPALPESIKESIVSTDRVLNVKPVEFNPITPEKAVFYQEKILPKITEYHPVINGYLCRVEVTY